MIFPVEAAAERCVDFITREAKRNNTLGAEAGSPCARIATLGEKNLEAYIVFFDETYKEFAMRYWSSSGDGISSRHAEHLLKKFKKEIPNDLNSSMQEQAEQTLK